MKVVIYGGRDWDDQDRLNQDLESLHATYGFTEIINGGQTSRSPDRKRLFGADWQAAVWSQARAIPIRYFYANWIGEGKKAGPLRNQRMVEYGPELGVEFPGGAGTMDMRRRLKAAGIGIVEVGRCLNS